MNASAFASKITFLTLPDDGGLHLLALPSIVDVSRLLPLSGVVTTGDVDGAGEGGSLRLVTRSLDEAVRLWDLWRVAALVSVWGG